MSAKRAFDLLCVVPGLIFLSPLFLLVAVWIKLDSPGPVFFRQTRVGKDGRLFQIFKFRSMVPNAEMLGAALTVGEDPRITRSGRLLRKLKLDELPQLWNVLRGDMSLVGPRPEVPKYVAHYDEAKKSVVLSIRPGITDPASIEFFDESELLANAPDPEAFYVQTILPRKLALYEEYVRTASLWRDIGIIFRTIALAFGKVRIAFRN